MSDYIVAPTTEGHKVIDLTGQRFGRLRVLGQSIYRDKRKLVLWVCVCDCGAIKVVNSNKLLQEQIAAAIKKNPALAKIKKDVGADPNKKFVLGKLASMVMSTVDRQSRGRIAQMQQAGTGDILEEIPGIVKDTVESLDNSGPYCKENCKWSTPRQQANNTRRNRRLTFRGETLTVAQWARRMGLKPNTLRARITEYGWSAERALTTP